MRGSFAIFGEQASAWLSHALPHRHGIQTAFQEMTLVRDLTVLDNMLLPYAPDGLTRHDPSAARRESAVARASCGSIGLDGVDLDAEVGELDLAVQQKIEIARAHLSASPASCCSTSRHRPCPGATSTGWASSSRA